MSIQSNYREVKMRVSDAALRARRDPSEVQLMAVTKMHSPDEINQAIDAGATDIGENKVQEILEKYDKVNSVRWHLIGHLQTNKVKNIIDKVVMIHSVDSLRLAKEIDKRASNIGIKMDILIQINSAMEATKTGISHTEVRHLAEDICGSCENLRICGIMCIPPMSDNPESTRQYFRQAKEIFDSMKDWGLPLNKCNATTLSMGMSNDYQVAIEEGATIVRIGSAIMGSRNYR